MKIFINTDESGVYVMVFFDDARSPSIPLTGALVGSITIVLDIKTIEKKDGLPRACGI